MRRRQRDHEAVGPRARSVLEVVLRRGEVSGPDILAELPDVPSYSALRSILRSLEDKGLIQHRARGLKFVYRARVSKAAVSRRVLERVLQTYFGGAPEHAMRALIDVARESDEAVDFDALSKLIDDARKAGR